jgi:hypothetical protein
MTPRNPPRLATALLNAFAGNEPLAGDLEEEFRAGRSALWYWRQVLAAVAAAQRRRTSIHDVFAPQNMPMQVIMLGLISVCAVFTVKVTVFMMIHDGARIVNDPGFVWEVFRLALSFVVATGAGAAIARLHDRHRDAAVLAFAASMALWSLVNLYVLDGEGNLDSAVTHVLALLVFVSGLLAGGLHLQRPPHRQRRA